MSVRLLESGYWHVRWSANRWFQWPKWRLPTMADGFGWVTEKDLRDVLIALREHLKGDVDD